MIDEIMNTSIEVILNKYQQRRNLMVSLAEHQHVCEALNAAYLAGRDRGTIHHPTYTRIDIEGPKGAYAVYHRPPGLDVITAQVLTPGRTSQHIIPDEDLMKQVAAAGRIYQQVAGTRPGLEELDLYMRPIEHLFADFTPGEPYRGR